MADKRPNESRTESQQSERGLERRPERSRGLATRSDPFDFFGSSPFSLMRRMQQDMDRLFGSFWGHEGLSPFVERERGYWSPAVDVFQRGNELIIRADVPGMSRDDLTVEVGDDAVTIRGERKYDHEEEREGIYRSERSYGSFYRTIPLPEGTLTDTAKANFHDGVLEIVLQAPPQEAQRGRRLEIGEGKQKEIEQKKER